MLRRRIATTKGHDPSPVTRPEPLPSWMEEERKQADAILNEQTKGDTA